MVVASIIRFAECGPFDIDDESLTMMIAMLHIEHDPHYCAQRQWQQQKFELGQSQYKLNGR